MTRRKTIVVKKRFQLLYVGYIVFFMLVASFIAGWTVFHTLFMILGDKLAGIYPEGRLMQIFTKTMLELVRNLIILLPFIVAIGVVLSHRIAGPVYRIERAMEEIGGGNFKIRIFLRRKDQLQEMADALNRMTELLDVKEASEKEAASVIANDLNEMRNQLTKGNLDNNSLMKRISEIEEAVKKLRKV